MNILIDIRNFNTICRICLQNKKNMSIQLTSEINCMIEACTSVQENYVDNKMPQQICNECYSELKDAYQFRQKYIQSTQILTEIILKTEIQTDNGENDEKIFKNNYEFQTNAKQEFGLCVNEDNDDKTQIDSDVENNVIDENIKKSHVKLKKLIRVKNDNTIKTNRFNKNEYMCDICGKKFRKRKYLNVHKISHSNARPYECTVCHRTFKYTFTLTAHMRVKHNDPDRREICFVCGKFVLPNSFSYHLSTHRRTNIDDKYKCDICARVYTREDILRRHFQEKHTDSINIRFYCDICNKGYISKGSLKIHKKYTHNTEKNYKCEFCDKSYKMLSQMRAHINSAHKDLRPHTCSTCNKAFHTKTLLRKHMICHTGERPYSCEICGKSFGTKSVLKTHKKVHLK